MYVMYPPGMDVQQAVSYNRKISQAWDSWGC